MTPSSSNNPALAGISKRVAVIQDGARGHYGVPIALQRAGLLERLYTDWFVTPGSRQEWISRAICRFRPALGQRMLDRQCDELEKAKIQQSLLLMVRQQAGFLRREPAHVYHRWSSLLFADWVRRRGLGQANAIFGFVRNMAPELAAECRKAGLTVVADQFIAPAKEELAESMIQAERWPGWQPLMSASGDLNAVDTVERNTWEVAHHLTCASEYVRNGLIRQGVDPSRITVIPYPTDEGLFPFLDRRGRTGPMIVGFVGAVNLRKGVPYFLQVARRFDPAKVKFVMVGPLQVDPAVLERHRGPVDIVGAVPRSQVAEWVKRFDVFFFPSTCEGSALSLMEAMASGLPVVTSPNSGPVARHEREGFISDYDDADRFEAYLNRLADAPEFRWGMGQAARVRYETFNLDWYSRAFKDLFSRLI